jgi:hypothetical protein
LDPHIAFAGWFLDDGLAARHVADLLAAVERHGRPLGLHLNLAKCELVSAQDVDASLAAFPAIGVHSSFAE